METVLDEAGREVIGLVLPSADGERLDASNRLLTNSCASAGDSRDLRAGERTVFSLSREGISIFTGSNVDISWKENPLSLPDVTLLDLVAMTASCLDGLSAIDFVASTVFITPASFVSSLRPRV